MGGPTSPEEQIVAALRGAAGGTPAVEVGRTLGISEQPCSRWQRTLVGLGVAELRRLKHLEDENRRLQPLGADRTLDTQMLPEGVTTKW